jgi:hypothetical protein
MARESQPARTGLTLALNMKERVSLCIKFRYAYNADIACEEDKIQVQLKMNLIR